MDNNKKVLEEQINRQEEKLNKINSSVQNSKVRIEMLNKQKDDYTADLKELGVSPQEVKSEISKLNGNMVQLYNKIIDSLPLELLLKFNFVTKNQITQLKKGLTKENSEFAEKLYEKSMQLKQSAVSQKTVYLKQQEEVDSKMSKLGITREDAETKLNGLNDDIKNIYDEINALVPELSNPGNSAITDGSAENDDF